MKRLMYLCTLAAAILAAGCATTKRESATPLAAAKSPTLSISSGQKEMLVSVSPVRQTVLLLGSSAAILGAGVDAFVNEKYSKPVLEALKDYDEGAIFEQRLRVRLDNALSQDLGTSAPLGTTAGFHTIRQAEEARWQAIANSGYDTLLDFRTTYGIFGFEGTLVAKLEGKILEVPSGHAVWRNALVVSTEPVLASDKLSDPTKQMGPNVSSPRLTVDEDAVKRWTQDNGKYLREKYEHAVDCVIAALLVDLGLEDSADGRYCLGRGLMNRKKFDEADAHFAAAIKLAPDMVDAYNARAVNLARNKQLDNAIALATEITKKWPEYGPAWYNLAWWHAVEKKDAAAAAGCYKKARALGMPEEKKIEKILAQ